MSIPRVRSERPAFEAHYPHLLERLEAEAHSVRPLRPVGGLAGATIGVSGPRSGERDPDPGG